MSERSFPFDGGEGSILVEADWSSMASLWQDDGVADAPGGTALKVVSEEIPGKIRVRAGKASFRGFHYHLDADMELSYTPNTHTTLTRRDLVVLRLDWGTNKISLAVKEGVPGGVTPPPDVDGPTPEMPLASYTVPVNSGPVQASLVTDLRSYVGSRVRVAGNANPDFPDGTVFYDQAGGAFYGMGRPPGAGSSVAIPFNQPLPFNEARYRTTDLPIPEGSGKHIDSELSIVVPGNAIYQFEFLVFYTIPIESMAQLYGLRFPVIEPGDRVVIAADVVESGSTETYPRRRGETSTSTFAGATPFETMVWSYTGQSGALNWLRITGTFDARNGSNGPISGIYESHSGRGLGAIWQGSYLKVREV